MIDLHNHIIPGVDDGAIDLEESVEIARQFAREGVVRIAATPHIDPERGKGVGAQTVRELVPRVQEAVRAAGENLDIVPGNELYLVPHAPDLLKDGLVATLGGGSYVLVELSVRVVERPLYLDDTIFRLQLAGYSVILAHPERYSFVQRNPAVFDELVERDVALQLTAPALLGEYGPATAKAAEALLRRGAFRLAASDRHHPGSNRSLASLHAKISGIAGEETADLLLKENPSRVLESRDLLDADPAPRKRTSFLGKLFNRA